MRLVSDRTFAILATIEEHGTADTVQVNEAVGRVNGVDSKNFARLEARGWVERVGRIPDLHSLIRRRLTSLGILYLEYGRAERRAFPKARDK
jgi:hypothetical protein